MNPVEDFDARPSHVRFLGSESAELHGRWYQLIAEHYDSIYGPDRPGEASAFLHEIFQRHGPVQSVLDVACGTFSIDLKLLERGYEVEGHDVSSRMLDAARRNLQQAGREAELLQMDMAEGAVSRRFDAVICLGTAFNYLFQERAWGRALQRFHRHLRRDGTLVLDLANFAKWIDDPENAGVDVDYTAPDGTRITFFRYNEQNADKSQHLARFLTVFRREEDLDIAVDEAVLKVWHKKPLSATLRNHGFNPVEWWGDLKKGEAYDPAESPRLICVAQRR